MSWEIILTISVILIMMYLLITEKNGSSYEAVVSLNSPLVDKSPKDIDFRDRYGAAIIAVSRKGERIVKKIGDIVFKPGDTFKQRWECGNDFFHIAQKDNKIKFKKGNSFFNNIYVLTVIIIRFFI